MLCAVSITEYNPSRRTFAEVTPLAIESVEKLDTSLSEF